MSYSILKCLQHFLLVQNNIILTTEDNFMFYSTFDFFISKSKFWLSKSRKLADFFLFFGSKCVYLDFNRKLFRIKYLQGIICCTKIGLWTWEEVRQAFLRILNVYTCRKKMKIIVEPLVFLLCSETRKNNYKYQNILKKRREMKNV